MDRLLNILSNIWMLLRNFCASVQSVLGGILCFLGFLLIFGWTFLLIYEVLINGKYAYVLPCLLMIVASIYCIGLFLLDGYYLWNREKVEKKDCPLYRPTRLDERLEFEPVIISICRMLFFLALIQFVYGIKTGAEITDDENPVLAVAIIVGIASGMAWMGSAFVYYLDKRARDKKEKALNHEKAIHKKKTYFLLWAFIKVPYSTFFRLIKQNKKGR